MESRGLSGRRAGALRRVPTPRATRASVRNARAPQFAGGDVEGGDKTKTLARVRAPMLNSRRPFHGCRKTLFGTILRHGCDPITAWRGGRWPQVATEQSVGVPQADDPRHRDLYAHVTVIVRADRDISTNWRTRKLPRVRGAGTSQTPAERRPRRFARGRAHRLRRDCATCH